MNSSILFIKFSNALFIFISLILGSKILSNIIDSDSLNLLCKESVCLTSLFTLVNSLCKELYSVYFSLIKFSFESSSTVLSKVNSTLS